MLSGAAAAGLPSDCVHVAELCLALESEGMQRAGIALLSGMRESPHAAAACVMLAELVALAPNSRYDAESGARARAWQSGASENAHRNPFTKGPFAWDRSRATLHTGQVRRS